LKFPIRFVVEERSVIGHGERFFRYIVKVENSDGAYGPSREKAERDAEFMNDYFSALLDDYKRMRSGIDAIYNYSDEAREAVIECYGLHHNSALDKLKEITSATD